MRPRWTPTTTATKEPRGKDLLLWHFQVMAGDQRQKHPENAAVSWASAWKPRKAWSHRGRLRSPKHTCPLSGGRKSRQSSNAQRALVAKQKYGRTEQRKSRLQTATCVQRCSSCLNNFTLTMCGTNAKYNHKAKTKSQTENYKMLGSHKKIKTANKMSPTRP